MNMTIRMKNTMLTTMTTTITTATNAVAADYD
jgi:hypothetical protein